MPYRVFISASNQSYNIGVGQYGTEQDRMHQLSDRVKFWLETQKGKFVVFRNMPGWSLQRTVDYCNALACDIFVENHTNAHDEEQIAGDGGAEGTEVFYYHQGGINSKSYKLASTLYKHIAPLSPGIDRGILPDNAYKPNLYVIQKTRPPAALVEHFFHTNYAEVRDALLNLDKYAKAEAMAICEYFGERWQETLTLEQSITEFINSMIKKGAIVLKFGSKGEEVKRLQKLLYITADGIFGKDTRAAVIQFQKNNGLVTDGIVGPKTWGAFNRPYVIIKPNRYTVIVKTKKSAIKKADVILAKQPVEYMDSIYRRCKPTILINAGLFDMRTGATVSRLVNEGKSWASSDITWYGLYIKEDNIIGFGDYRYVGKVRDFLGASPSLVKQGKVMIDNPLRSIMAGYNPRSAVGMDDDYFFVVAIDGRRILLPGMTGNQLAKFMANTLKCKEAMNLDGGHSTRLLVNGKTINNPSGLRAVDTALAIYV